VEESRCFDEIIEFVLDRLRQLILSDIDKGRASPAKEYAAVLTASLGEVAGAAAKCRGDGIVLVSGGEVRVIDTERYRAYVEKALLELRMKVFDKAMETLSKFVDISGTSLYARLSAVLLAYASSLMEVIDYAYLLVSSGGLPAEMIGFVEGIVVVLAARFYALCRLLSTLEARRLARLIDRVESIVEGFIGQDVAMKYVLMRETALRSQVVRRTRVPGL